MSSTNELLLVMSPLTSMTCNYRAL